MIAIRLVQNYVERLSSNVTTYTRRSDAIKPNINESIDAEQRMAARKKQREEEV